VGYQEGGLGWGLGWAGLRLGWEVSGQAGRQRAGGRAVTVAMADLPMLMTMVIAMPAAMVTFMATMPMVVLVNLLWLGCGWWSVVCVCVCLCAVCSVGWGVGWGGW
jgi:hypothetical protein